MPQTIQIAVSITINPPVAPPPPPITANPASTPANPIVLPAETSGVAVSAQQVAQVSGGTPPYLAPVVDPSSPSPLPAGMTAAIDSNGNVTISGTPPVVAAPTTGVVVFDVVDSGV